jgi:hypothetical protein
MHAKVVFRGDDAVTRVSNGHLHFRRFADYVKCREQFIEAIDQQATNLVAPLRRGSRAFPLAYPTIPAIRVVAPVMTEDCTWGSIFTTFYAMVTGTVAPLVVPKGLVAAVHVQLALFDAPEYVAFAEK